MLCRQIERLLEDGLVRQAQIDDFERIITKMHTDKPAGEMGADVLLELLSNNN